MTKNHIVGPRKRALLFCLLNFGTMTYLIHCDGAAAPTNPGPTSLGVVLHTETGEAIEFSHYIGHGTNQTAELNAALYGLRLIPIHSEVTLISDSQYVLKGLTEWRKGWEAKGWRNSQKRPIANKALWMDLFHEYDQRTVTCKWVRGHTGNEFNERADKLATRALIDNGFLPEEPLS